MIFHIWEAMVSANFEQGENQIRSRALEFVDFDIGRALRYHAVSRDEALGRRPRQKSAAGLALLSVQNRSRGTCGRAGAEDIARTSFRLDAPRSMWALIAAIIVGPCPALAPPWKLLNPIRFWPGSPRPNWEEERACTKWRSPITRELPLFTFRAGRVDRRCTSSAILAMSMRTMT
jgi:hypothetical protein